MFTAKQIAKQLGGLLGQTCAYINENVFEEMDGEVTITPEISIQVGTNYLSVTHQLTQDEFQTYPYRNSINALLADIAKAKAGIV